MAASDPKDELKPWAPPAASPRAAAAWRKPWWTRAKELMVPGNQEVIQEYIIILVESFSYEQFRYAIEKGYDILPLVDKKFALNNVVAKSVVRMVIRLQWSTIYDYLSHPTWVRNKLRELDPQKAALFDTPSGNQYLNWLCWHLIALLRQRGEIRGNAIVASPPGVCPLHQGMCTTPPPPRISM